MTNFDEQWKKVMDEEHFNEMKGKFDFTQKRVEEFQKLTDIKDNGLNGKICLDAGCGPGRWTYAMQQLGAQKVDSFDVSSEAIKRCKEINPDAYVGSIFDLKPNPLYDFVLSWGVLHHNKNTREAFSKVASQVKKDSLLHIMVYDKKYDNEYDGYRGETSIEKHKEWEKLSFEEKIKICENKVKTIGGDIHGWFDAFNPEVNFSFTPKEVKKWFEAEGFHKIKLRVKSHFNSIPTSQVNMNGIKS